MTTRQLQRILLVDDDPDIRRVGELALERVGGFDVEICACGEEALHRAPAFKPDLLLLDVMMPEMDGVTLYQNLSRDPHIDDVPVIFITAKAQQPEVVRYLALGAIGVIKKPFDPMGLADKVRTIWSRQFDGRQDAEDDDIEVLRQLVDTYQQKLAQRLQKLDDLLSQVTGADSRQTLLEVKRVAHQLAGSGAMFGLPAVSEICSELETITDELLNTERPIEDHDRQRLLPLCRRLENIIDNESLPGSRPEGSSGGTLPG